MRLFEITDQNAMMRAIHDFKMNYTDEYEALSHKLIGLKFSNFAPRLLAVVKPHFKSETDEFERNVLNFINFDWPEIDDQELIDDLALARKQLANIKKLRLQVNI